MTSKKLGVLSVPLATAAPDRGGGVTAPKPFRFGVNDERLRLVREAAGDRYEQLQLNALVQRVVVTDNRRQAAEELARRWTPLSPAEVLASPYVLVGTIEQQVEDLQARRERWGLSYYVVFEPYVDAFAPVVARLAGR
jgi:hypothetical protein